MPPPPPQPYPPTKYPYSQIDRREIIMHILRNVSMEIHFLVLYLFDSI